MNQDKENFQSDLETLKLIEQLKQITNERLQNDSEKREKAILLIEDLEDIFRHYNYCNGAESKQKPKLKIKDICMTQPGLFHQIIGESAKKVSDREKVEKY